MHHIFDYTDEDRSLPEELEVQLILVAQGRADAVGKPDAEAAKLRLLEAYSPVIRNAVRRYGSGLASGLTNARELEDLRASALVGALEAIATHDPEVYPRIGQRMVHHLNRALADENTTTFAVPSRTLTRFYGIVAAADGDFDAAEDLAPSFEMSVDTFRTLRNLVASRSLDNFGDDDAAEPNAAPLFAPSPVVDVEDRILVDMAFRAMDDDELRICELYYGFTEYDPVPDAEIAHRVGASRPAVQRKRNKALAKARKALGVELEEA